MENGETAVLALFFMCGIVEEVYVDGDEVEREGVEEEVEMEERIIKAIAYKRIWWCTQRRTTEVDSCPNLTSRSPPLMSPRRSRAVPGRLRVRSQGSLLCGPASTRGTTEEETCIRM